MRHNEHIIQNRRPRPPTTHHPPNVQQWNDFTREEEFSRETLREEDFARSRRFCEKKILREEILREESNISQHHFWILERTETDSRIDWFDDSNQKLNRQANRLETSNWGIRIKSCSRSPLFLECTCERACAREEKISLSEYVHCTDISFSNLV